MEEGVINLSEIEKDALIESANVGAGNASTSLSDLLDKKVNIVVSDMNFVLLKDLQDAVGGPKKLVVGVYTPISGDMSGTIIIVFPIEAALALSNIFKKDNQPSPENTLSKEDQEVLKKIGVIVSDSYMSSLSDFLEMKMGREEPKIVTTFGESVIDLIMISIDLGTKHGLLIKTGFNVEETEIKGEFVLLLTTGNIGGVLNKIKEKTG